jgi:hypothetical protein
VHGTYEGIETESLLQVEMNRTNGCEKFHMEILVAMKDLSILQLLFLACGGFRLLVHYFIPIQKTTVSIIKNANPGWQMAETRGTVRLFLQQHPSPIGIRSNSQIQLSIVKSSTHFSKSKLQQMKAHTRRQQPSVMGISSLPPCTTAIQKTHEQKEYL